jgi:hypothetical protein
MQGFRIRGQNLLVGLFCHCHLHVVAACPGAILCAACENAKRNGYVKEESSAFLKKSAQKTIDSSGPVPV